MSSLAGRIAFVTGGSGGLGRALAARLAKEGATVAVGFLRHSQRADEVVDQISRAGGAAFSMRCDVAEYSQVVESVDSIVSLAGGLDVLINNAGVLVRPSSWQDVDYEAWNETLNVNLRGVFNCSKAAHLFLCNSPHAAIINVASTTGPLIAAPGAIAYGASKAGVIALTRTFAKALAPRVRVNAVCPGFIDAGITNSASPDFLDAQIRRTLLQRLGQPEEVADAVVFLSTASYVTGQVVIVDGGHSLA